jgi:hypothetical protein
MGTHKIRIYYFLPVSFVRVDKERRLLNSQNRNSGFRSNYALSKVHFINGVFCVAMFPVCLRKPFFHVVGVKMKLRARCR